MIRMCQIVQIQQCITSDSYGTCFPQTEELLNESKYQSALEEIGSRKDMSKYRSMMDFLLCELKPRYKKDCFRYYNEKGPRLNRMESERELELLDNYLSGALMIALECKEQGVKASWNAFCEGVAYMAAELTTEEESK